MDCQNHHHQVAGVINSNAVAQLLTATTFHHCQEYDAGTSLNQVKAVTQAGTLTNSKAVAQELLYSLTSLSRVWYWYIT